jgi:hypothetical protein
MSGVEHIRSPTLQHIAEAAIRSRASSSLLSARNRAATPSNSNAMWIKRLPVRLVTAALLTSLSIRMADLFAEAAE